MKTLTRNKLIALIAAIMVISSSVGVALAYFSAYDAAAGEAKLVLGGSTSVTEEFTKNNKVITISNTGKTNVVVRVGIYGPNGMQVVPEKEGDWVPIGDFWYYTHVLEPGADASIINATIDGIPVNEDMENFDIVVASESAMAVAGEGNKVQKPANWEAIPDISIGE